MDTVKTPQGEPGAATAGGGAALDALRQLSLAHPLDAASADLLYRHGYALCQQGKYQLASGVFTFLHLLDPIDTRVLKALAVCHRAVGRLPEAQVAYDLALMLDPRDVETGLGAVSCLVAGGQWQEARETMTALQVLLAEKAQSADINARAQQLVAVLGTRTLQ